ncbi:MAG: hypothetical protein M5U34_41370 [Chloroflexi bacterium]|nr:hypothetical protein [Chloroflexota bacterium]
MKKKEKLIAIHKDDLDGSGQAPENRAAATDAYTPSYQNWMAGVVLIAIGVIFLAANFVDFHLNNWWALFILDTGRF